MPNRNQIKAVTTAGLAFLIILAGARPSRAAGTLKQELSDLAKDVKKLFDDRQESSIAVMTFGGSPELANSSGPGVGKILADELSAAGLTVKARARLGIKGSIIAAADSKDEKLKVAKLLAKIVDGSDKAIKEFEREFTDEATIAVLLGVSAEPSRDADKTKRNQEIFEKPKAEIKGSRVNAGESGKFGIEVLVKGSDGEYKPRPAENVDGQAFVPLARDDVYAVRLFNDSPEKVAVSLNIDGLSMFTFSDKKDYTHLILAPGQAALIKGWHHTNERSREFQVAELPRGNRPVAGPVDNVGTITACFSARKVRIEKDLQTIEGKPVSMTYVPEPFPIGDLLATASVRYTK